MFPPSFFLTDLCLVTGGEGKNSMWTGLIEMLRLLRADSSLSTCTYFSLILSSIIFVCYCP
jgi:hypothetical protein